MNKKLNDKELENVNGGWRPDFNPPRASGEVTLHNMPKINPKDKYVMGVDANDIQIIGTCGPTSTET